MYIEIITTPNSALKESGFGTSIACINILEAIHKMGYNAKLNVCRSKGDLKEIVKRKPGLVVLAVKYIPIEGEKSIWLADYFDQHRINFTGSIGDVLKFDSNKVLAKTHLINKGINTADYFMANPGQYETEHDLPIKFPLFLKPLDAANGNGIDDLSYVTNFKDFVKKVESIYNTFNQPVLVERYLGGHEYSVAIIEAPDKKLIVSAVEIVPPTSSNGLKILGAKAKKDDTEKLLKICDNNIKNKIIELAIDAYKALGARDFGRIDIKSNNDGDCFFLEANLVPGMTLGSSYFPLACEIEHEFTYEKVIELLLGNGLARAFSTLPPNVNPEPNGKIVAFK